MENGWTEVIREGGREMSDELCPNCGTHCLNNTVFCTPPIMEKDTVEDYTCINVQVVDEDNPPIIALLLTRGQIALLKYWFESHHAEGRDGSADMEIYKALVKYGKAIGKDTP